MFDFINLTNHKRYLDPVNAGDIMVKEKLDKYLKERANLERNKKYDISKLVQIEANNLKDDFDFWWYRVDRSYINELIKLMKFKGKIK